MRVLHLINNLPVGGAERFLVLLAAAEKRRGLDVEVAALATPNPLAADLQARGIPFTPLARPRLNDPRLLFDVRRLLRERRPDVLHTHLFYADTVGRAAARWAGTPVVVSTEHSTEGAPLSLRRRSAMRATARFADRIVAVAEPVRQATAARLGIDPGRIDVIPNGIEIETWENAAPLVRSELGAAPDALLAGTTGRLDDPKGIDVLIDAVAKLDDPRLRLLLAGDGPRRSALEAQAAARGIDSRVHFLGFFADVPRFLATLDVYVQPSRWEGHSMGLLEAMAAGRACIVSDIPELAAVVGDAAVRVAPDDATALAAALRSLLGDPAARTRLGRAARARVQPYSIDASAARYATLYAELLHDGPVG